ncbi:MAG: histidine kinase N-terminal domain-containing protein [Clostridium sp.]|uniref:histidine kinase N-terminal domain-containing protein n=1 Tax=Clostridium sp. TaxID=1506 RepID=UPI003F363503
MIEVLCGSYTDLNEDDIIKIQEISKSLKIMANFYESDVFIDVLCKDNNNAMVIAHAKPDKVESLYIDKVVGKVALEQNEPAVLETLKIGNVKRDIKALTQEEKLVRQNIQPILNGNKVVGVVIVEKDISEELESEFKVDMSLKDKNSKDFLELIKDSNIITDNLHEAILVYDEKGTLIINNNKASKIYEKLGNVINDRQHFNEISLGNKTFTEVTKMKEKEIVEVRRGNLYFKISRIIFYSAKVRVIEILEDITEMKQNEIELILRSVAIKEAHHRIKNSLQTVASLLRSQSRKSESNEAKKYLKEAVDRIFAVSTTHDLLAKSEGEKVKVKEAIGILVENINKSISNKESNIYINGDNFYITGQKLSSLLLVINEVIQNCYDHAFKDKENGTIRILIQSNEEEKTIAVVDDGNGYNIEGAKEKNSLGLKIIKSYMIDSLKGNFEVISNEKGTQTILKFRID